MITRLLLTNYADKFQEVMSSVTAAAPTGAYSGKYVDALRVVTSNWLTNLQVCSPARCWFRVSHAIAHLPILQTNNHSTRPTVDVLAKSGVKVTVACRTLEKAQGLAKGIPNTNAISVRTFTSYLHTPVLTITARCQRRRRPRR
jgi:hypothetical protein